MTLELAALDWKTTRGEYRQEVTLQGLTAVQCFDGHAAWQIQPFEGRKDPSLMSADEAKGLARSADLAFPFVDAKAKGHRVEYLGLQDVDGTPAHTLKVALASGDESTFWIDPDTWMVIRELDREVIRGVEQFSETDFSDYEKVDGLYVPMAEASGPRDSDEGRKAKVIFDRAEINVPLDPRFFAFPGATKEAVR
jgi:hypothetical protein